MVEDLQFTATVRVNPDRLRRKNGDGPDAVKSEVEGAIYAALSAENLEYISVYINREEADD